MDAGRSDVLIVGAGAAGIFAALAARGTLAPDGGVAASSAGAPSVRLLDASRRIGLKILVSGGGRCNVTNESVDERDFESGAPHVVRGLLAAFPPRHVRRFFADRGCPLYAEPLGKLFPVSDRARDVLGVLLAALDSAGVALESGARVTALGRDDAPPGPALAPGWRATTADGRAFSASRLVVATGGKSLPRTGSTGFGFEVARRLGHRLEEPLPALTPLFLAQQDAPAAPRSPLAGLAGVTVPALLSLVPRDAPPEQVEGRRFAPRARAAGSLLVTHRGASGPAALDVSGACARELDAEAEVVLEGDFWSLTRPGGPWSPYRDLDKPPGACLPPPAAPRPLPLDEFRAEVRGLAGDGRARLATVLAARLPRSLVDALLAARAADGAREARSLRDGDWRTVHAALVHADLQLTGVDGFEKAEVTRGGVRLAELHRATLESRSQPGLFFCGEVVDCTGRLGGFNFQWAWSSGYAVGAALHRSARTPE